MAQLSPAPTPASLRGPSGAHRPEVISGVGVRRSSSAGVLLQFALRRLLTGLVQVPIVVVVVFGFISALPGDAAVVLAGEDPDPERIDMLRRQYGLDRPAHERMLEWFAHAFRGDLGVSHVSGRPVAAMIGDALSPTVLLASVTVLVIIPAALVLGIAAGTRAGGRLDRVISSTAVGIYAIPEFAFAVLAITGFAVWLRVLPATALGAGGGGISDARFWVLPVVVLAARPICSLTRMLRTSIAETMRTEPIGHLSAAGVPRARIISRYVLPVSLIPAVQHLARTVDWLLGGVVVVEALFALGGLGQLMIAAVTGRDLPLALGLIVLFTGVTVTVNALADIFAVAVSPRALEELE